MEYFMILFLKAEKSIIGWEVRNSYTRNRIRATIPERKDRTFDPPAP